MPNGAVHYYTAITTEWQFLVHEQLIQTNVESTTHAVFSTQFSNRDAVLYFLQDADDL